MKRNSFLKFIFIFSIILSTLEIYSTENIQDQTLAAAERSQELRAWLAQNKSHSQYFETLLNYITIEEDPEILIQVLQAALTNQTIKSKQGEIHYKLGELLELLGRYDSAKVSYQNAAMLPGKEAAPARLNSARLLYEMGYYQDALVELEQIQPEGLNREFICKQKTLLGILYYATEKFDKALALFAQIYKENPQDEYYLAAMFFYIDILSEHNQTQLSEKIKKEILEKFPTAPESLLLKGYTQLEYFSVPRKYLNSLAAEKAPEQPVVTTTSAQSSQKPKTYFQTGSFTVKENAEYMVIELLDKGFQAVIIEKSIGEKIYHAVLVPMPLELTDTNQFLSKLQDNGFNGFKVDVVPGS